MPLKSLADASKESFQHRDRELGEIYFLHSRVRVTKIGAHAAMGTADGSHGHHYDVIVDWSDLGSQNLGVFCGCPRYEDGENCKHLWAFLRLCNPFLNVDSKSVRDALSEGDLYLDDCTPESVEELISDLPLAQAASNLSLAKPVEPRADFKKQPAWRNTLRKIQGRSMQSAPMGRPSVGRTLDARQHWFVLAFNEFTESEFRIRTYQSKLKGNGEWSVPTRFSLAEREIANLVDSSERLIFSLLRKHDPLGYYSTNTDYRLDAELLPETLNALCATQRFVWTWEVSQSLREKRELRFDEAGTWCFELSVAPIENGEIQVMPLLRLHPAKEPQGPKPQRDINQVLGVCDSGAILFEEEIAILRPKDVGHVRAWRELEGLRLPQSDLDAFLHELTLVAAPELVLDKRLDAEQAVGRPTGKLKLTTPRFDLGELEAEVLYVYGETEVVGDDSRDTLWNASARKLLIRDRQHEDELLSQLSQFAFKEDPWNPGLKIGRKHFVDLVARLTELGWEVVADDQRLRRPSSINIRVESNEDWFDLHADMKFDDVSGSLPDLLKALKNGERMVRLDDGSQGILPEEWLKKFSDLGAVGQVEEDHLRFRQNQALLLDQLLAEQEHVHTDRTYAQWCKKLAKFSGVRPAKQPRGLQGELREYQREGLGWLKFLQEFRFGGCLADDMGLGKTIQVLSLLETRRTRRQAKGDDGKAVPRKPSIAVVPKSLVFNWVREAAKFAPKLKVVDYTGLQRSQSFAEIPNCDLVVTTYATFRRDVEKFRDIQFDYAILDEAQAIKNPSALATKAVRLIQADHRLAVTGTPVENHLGDLWSLFDFLNPGMLGATTANSFTAADSRESRLGALQRALQPFVLRRTKEQVLKELPAKTEQTLVCEMTVGQKKLYKELRNHYRLNLMKKIKDDGVAKAKIHVLEALLRLRQVACDPRLLDEKQKSGAKLDSLMEQLEEVISMGHKALVFSQFTSLLALARNEFKRRKWEFAYLDGKTRKRDEVVTRFQDEPNCRLFLISLKAGGHGLNLTAADYVFILDPWWNPAVEAQAIDRAHRMGQQNPVNAYRLIAKDTVEEKIVQLQASKRELADAIISADKGLLGSMTAADIQILFD